MTASKTANLPAPDPSMQVVSSPTQINRSATTQAPSQEVFTFSANLQSTSLPPPGARAPMIRRASRFDPMETTPEEDGYDPTPRHPLRRIREDPQSPPLPERQERSDSVSLPGIKALLNVADQPPLVSPFGGSFFQSPSVKSAQSSGSPLDSPNSRTSRFSSLTSSAADSQGWWAPDDRSSGAGFSRTSSFSARGGEPDFKRRRSDLAPIAPDADETARLKWQAQSRNASFPATISGGAAGNSSGGGGLRSMLYPPPAPSSHIMRGSISGGTAMASPMSPDSPYDYHASSRSSPMTGPLARSFADLAAGERSPPSEAPTPLRARSPTDRRPSLFSQHLSSESVHQLNSRDTPPAASAAAQGGQRLSLTRPPSPEPAAPAPRRSSLAELIMAKSGDNVTMGQGGRFFHPLSSSSDHPNDRDVPYIGRRESTESIMSNVSASFGTQLSAEPDQLPPAGGRRAALVAPPLPGARRPSFDPVSEDELESKGDPGMRGMEVLAESARRVADAERKDSMEEDQPGGTSPAKTTGGTGPKYPCQYCKKAFTRPSSLRIHTYSRESSFYRPKLTLYRHGREAVRLRGPNMSSTFLGPVQPEAPRQGASPEQPAGAERRCPDEPPRSPTSSSWTAPDAYGTSATTAYVWISRPPSPRSWTAYAATSPTYGAPIASPTAGLRTASSPRLHGSATTAAPWAPWPSAATGALPWPDAAKRPRTPSSWPIPRRSTKAVARCRRHESCRPRPSSTARSWWRPRWRVGDGRRGG